MNRLKQKGTSLSNIIDIPFSNVRLVFYENLDEEGNLMIDVFQSDEQAAATRWFQTATIIRREDGAVERHATPIKL